MELQGLSEKPELQGLGGHAQYNEVSGLLDDLREAMNDYKVRSQPLNPAQCLQ